jgi:hypothetical protein
MSFFNGQIPGTVDDIGLSPAHRLNHTREIGRVIL